MILYIEDIEYLGRAVTRQICRGLRKQVAWHSYPVDPTGYDMAVLDWQPYGPEMVRRCVAAKVPFIVYTAFPPGVDRSLLPPGTRVLDKGEPISGLLEVIKEMVG